MRELTQQEKLNKFSNIDECPVRNIVSRFSGKWTMLVLCVLWECHPLRFNTIAKALPDISHKMLTDTLKKLEDDGMVQRTVYAEVPPKVEYSLTSLGESFMPHVESLVSWAMDNYDSVSAGHR